MILVDTNVLVALVDERDRLHARAVRDLDALKGPFATSSVVLSESCFLLPEAHFRSRLRALITRLGMRFVELDDDAWDAVFDWLSDYGEHEPDLCDAQLSVLAARTSFSIWSYDAEFRNVWRTPEGRPLRVVPAAARKPRRPRTSRSR